VSVIIREEFRSTDKIVAEKFPLGVTTVARVKPVPGGPDKGGLVGLGVGLGVEVGPTVGVGAGVGVGVGSGVVVGVGRATYTTTGDGSGRVFARPVRSKLRNGAAKLMPKTEKAAEKNSTRKMIKPGENFRMFSLGMSENYSENPAKAEAS